MSTSSSKPSFLHSVKQSLFHGEKHIDSDYETANTRFNNLVETLHKLKANANNYVSSVYSVFLNANNMSVDFSTVLDEAAVSNEYNALSQEFRLAHNRLNSDRQQEITADLTEKVLRPIDECLKNYQGLHARIVKRNELHGELEYYLNKVHDLNKEREERVSKGKSETSKHLEKFDRNQQKLNTCRNEYTAFTAPLIADLTNAWSARIEMLGPMLASLVQTEKRFLEIYSNELRNISVDTRKLATPPSEPMVAPIVASDVPRPVVAGDLHHEAREGPTIVANIVPGAGTTSNNVVTTSVPTDTTGIGHMNTANSLSNSQKDRTINRDVNPFDDSTTSTGYTGGAYDSSLKRGDSTADSPIVTKPSEYGGIGGTSTYGTTGMTGSNTSTGAFSPVIPGVTHSVGSEPSTGSPISTRSNIAVDQAQVKQDMARYSSGTADHNAPISTAPLSLSGESAPISSSPIDHNSSTATFNPAASSTLLTNESLNQNKLTGEEESKRQKFEEDQKAYGGPVY